MPSVKTKCADVAVIDSKTISVMKRYLELSKRLSDFDLQREKEKLIFIYTKRLLLSSIVEIENRLKDLQRSLNKLIISMIRNDLKEELFKLYVKQECEFKLLPISDKIEKIVQLGDDLVTLKCPAVDETFFDGYVDKDCIYRISSESDKLATKLKIGERLHSELNKTLKPDDLVRGQYLLWIEHFQEKRYIAYHEKSSECVSFRLMTSKHGYNILFKVFPNGIKDGTDSHLSVSIAIMKGEFDALLKWPFSQKITIRLINQTKPGNFIEAEVRRNSKHKKFERPSSFCNPDFLISRFVHIGCLNAERGFCLEDRILLSVSIDMAGITDPADICERNACLGCNTVIAQATD